MLAGSILSIEDATAGSVTMTAPFNRRTGRHVLGKVRTVQCSAVQYSTVQYSTVQYSTVQYSTGRNVLELGKVIQHCHCRKT